MFSSLFASLAAKVAGVALAATVATTGALAATGTLPAPAQQTAANLFAKVGVSIPAGPSHSGATAADSIPAVTPTVTASVTPSPTPSVTPTATVTDMNHGNCVSWAAQMASSLGFTGSQHGAFVSTIARDRAALSAPVTAGGQPSSACLVEIAKAEAALRAASPTPTSTATSASNANSGSHGKSSSAPGHATPTPAPSTTAGPAGSAHSSGPLSSSVPPAHPGHS
jgi:hypothetical protein